ncbi:MAG: hypothetical protein HY909_13190 [Deltaproteobacteria bacterium]|nr:hypothetical protein [Deltaproteobacteria bacterium]
MTDLRVYLCQGGGNTPRAAGRLVRYGVIMFLWRLLLVLGTLAALGCTTDFTLSSLPSRPRDGGDTGDDLGAGPCGLAGRACCAQDAGTPCAEGLACIGGLCVRCDEPRVACGDTCVALATDPAHCGACGSACPAGQGCVDGRCDATCPERQRACAGRCTFVENDAANCGRCGNACRVEHGVGGCVAGACVVGMCDPGFGNCDGALGNGCEASLATDPMHCGRCGQRCEVAHATPVCREGACALGACEAGWADCDREPGNGCEVNLSVSALHCGMCGRACDGSTGTPSCAAGVCGTAMCSPGRGDCDGMMANGCETDLRGTTAHCGACGNACAFAHGAATCAAGACVLGACEAGYGDCDGNPANGCETDLTTTPAHCGRCGNVCAFAHGAATCRAGACQLGACEGSYGDCDGMMANGCEASLFRADACGGCGNVCSYPNAAPLCAASECPEGTCYMCSRGACRAGFTDCDGMASNGCEAALDRDPLNCGACGTRCMPARAPAACAMSACGHGPCEDGYGDCDGNPANGCETDLNTSAAHCGACGSACRVANGAGRCAAGVCAVATCNEGFGDCDGMASNGCEAELNTPTACGACGTACMAGQVCADGRCAGACATDETRCAGGVCADLQRSVAHCGTCTTVCAAPPRASATCAVGVCGFLCDTGFADCDGVASNGCEVDTSLSVAHCGRCGAACVVAHGRPRCGAGTCQVEACDAGYGDCDGLASNGCETDLNTTASCGRCGNRCAVPAGSAATCVAGTCGFRCNAGFADCDLNPANGCEVSLQTDLFHCGRCGNRCWFPRANAACMDGACALSACVAPYLDCDMNRANGCEARGNLSNRCGACGVQCAAAAGSNQVSSCLTTAGMPACALSCMEGFANCDGNASNGCETDLRSTTHCGTSCASPPCTRAGATCDRGAAAGSMCMNGMCSRAGTTRCGSRCVVVSTDIAHCGRCDNRCAVVPNSAHRCGIPTGMVTAVCRTECANGTANCNGTYGDGCEVDTASDARNCGGCGSACPADQYCSSGFCCPLNTTRCGMSCTDTASDVSNCGACGVRCAAGQSCVRGACR